MKSFPDFLTNVIQVVVMGFGGYLISNGYLFSGYIFVIIPLLYFSKPFFIWLLTYLVLNHIIKLPIEQVQEQKQGKKGSQLSKTKNVKQEQKKKKSKSAHQKPEEHEDEEKPLDIPLLVESPSEQSVEKSVSPQQKDSSPLPEVPQQTEEERLKKERQERRDRRKIEKEIPQPEPQLITRQSFEEFKKQHDEEIRLWEEQQKKLKSPNIQKNEKVKDSPQSAPVQTVQEEEKPKVKAVKEEKFQYIQTIVPKVIQQETQQLEKKLKHESKTQLVERPNTQKVESKPLLSPKSQPKQFIPLVDEEIINKFAYQSEKTSDPSAWVEVNLKIDPSKYESKEQILKREQKQKELEIRIQQKKEQYLERKRQQQERKDEIEEFEKNLREKISEKIKKIEEKAYLQSVSKISKFVPKGTQSEIRTASTRQESRNQRENKALTPANFINEREFSPIETKENHFIEKTESKNKNDSPKKNQSPKKNESSNVDQQKFVPKQNETSNQNGVDKNSKFIPKQKETVNETEKSSQFVPKQKETVENSSKFVTKQKETANDAEKSSKFIPKESNETSKKPQSTEQTQQDKNDENGSKYLPKVITREKEKATKSQIYIPKQNQTESQIIKGEEKQKSQSQIVPSQPVKEDPQAPFFKDQVAPVQNKEGQKMFGKLKSQNIQTSQNSYQPKSNGSQISIETHKETLQENGKAPFKLDIKFDISEFTFPSLSNVEQLNMESLIVIIDAAVEISKKTYVNVIQNLRHSRRQFLKTDIQLYQTYPSEKQVQGEIFSKAFQIVLQQSGLTLSQYETAKQNFAQHEDYIERQSIIEQEFNESLPHKNILKSKYRDILKYKQQILSHQSDGLKDLKKKDKHTIQQLLDDLVYEQYSQEPEDQQFSNQKADQEIHGLLSIIQIQIEQFVQQ